MVHDLKWVTTFTTIYLQDGSSSYREDKVLHMLVDKNNQQEWIPVPVTDSTGLSMQQSFAAL